MKSVHCCFAGHRDYLNAEKGGPGGGRGEAFLTFLPTNQTAKLALLRLKFSIAYNQRQQIPVRSVHHFLPHKWSRVMHSCIIGEEEYGQTRKVANKGQVKKALAYQKQDRVLR